MFDVDQTSGVYRGNLLQLGERRMEWLTQRQQILAQNVANADTPGYAPSDAVSFDNAVDQFEISPTVTSEMHIGSGTGGVRSIKERREHSPDGNSVSLDSEMEKIADTEDQQKLASSIYKAYVSMFDTALGK